MLSRARGMDRARPMRPPGRTVGTRASRQSEREPPALLPASRAFAMARAKRGVTTTGAAVFHLVIVPELFLQTGQFNGTCPHGHTPTRRVRPRDDEQRRRVVCVGGGAWGKVTRTSKSISVWRFMSFLLICWQVVGTEYDYLRATTR